MFPLQGGTPPSGVLYSDDVFSAYTYTGNGTTQTINNGIDLAGKGGLVWLKQRSTGFSGLIDSAQGRSKVLSSSTTSAATTSGSTVDLTSFNSNGFSLGTPNQTDNNSNGISEISWTFRKAPKFFDVVTYTGNGAASRNIAHSLGSTPGFIIVKRTDAAGDWCVAHRSTSAIGLLNTTAAFSAALSVGNPAYNGYVYASDGFSTSTTFYVANGDNGNAAVNASGGTYVAYLFAHDASADGIVQCGSFTTDASGNATVSLGWEPQYLLLKKSNGAGDWFLADSSRGFDVSGGSKYLSANSTAAEAGLGNIQPNATGFKSVGALNPTTDFIYLAIRRPNKPPTTGTQVYNAIARTGTGAVATVTGVGFAPDLVVCKNRTATFNHIFQDRLRGAQRQLYSDGTFAEGTSNDIVTALTMDGMTVGLNGAVNYSAVTYINYFFKRAPGVFDEVCYTGTGVAKTEAHGLGVVPELMIVKGRSQITFWPVYHASTSAAGSTFLNITDAYSANSTIFNATAPTATLFTVGVTTISNGNNTTYVAYLFATKAGISKVFSYTGNGGSLTVNCGFTTGARWVMIKRTDSTGDWFVWDSTRGIVAGNDPHLSLNTTAAEVTTDDSVDTDTTGFIVNQLAATNVNVTSATYIGLAFA